MDRYDKLVELKANIDNAIVAMTELLERFEKIVAEVDLTKKATRKLIVVSEIPEAEMQDLINLYDKWDGGLSVKVGEVYRHNGKLWEVIQAHTTQADWEPQTVPALFKPYTPETTSGGEEIVPDFKQPTGAHDAYKKGDKVNFEGKVYESLIDANTYSPSAYPQGWKEVPKGV